jgi:hypothetical protein
MAILSLLVAEFGRGLRADLRASGGFYEEAQNDQLARSALVAAQIELLTAGALMYADPTGNVYFVTSEETAESEIAALAPYRQGLSPGRGMCSYRILTKPYALDINELGAAALGRLFEVACGLEDSTERSVLVDSILDWIDADDVQRAYGAEEEFYQALDRPRHCRNDSLGTIEELLLVNGMTPDLLFGYGLPARIEDGMLLGGGLYRFLIGDNCPEAQASVQYILRGVSPSDNRNRTRVTEVASGFQKITELPLVLYLVAEGFIPPATGSGESSGSIMEESAPADTASRRIILVKLTLPENGRIDEYTVGDFQENAAGELLEQVLTYGVPEETNEL